MASKLSSTTKVTITLAEFKRLKEFEAKVLYIVVDPPPYTTDEEEEEEEGGIDEYECGCEYGGLLGVKPTYILERDDEEVYICIDCVDKWIQDGWKDSHDMLNIQEKDAMAYRDDVESRCPEGHRTVWNDKSGRFDYVPTDGAKVEEEPIICTECSRDFTEEVDGRSSFEEEGKVICIDCFSSLY